MQFLVLQNESDFFNILLSSDLIRIFSKFIHEFVASWIWVIVPIQERKKKQLEFVAIAMRDSCYDFGFSMNSFCCVLACSASLLQEQVRKFNNFVDSRNECLFARIAERDFDLFTQFLPSSMHSNIRFDVMSSHRVEM